MNITIERKDGRWEIVRDDLPNTKIVGSDNFLDVIEYLIHWEKTAKKGKGTP